MTVKSVQCDGCGAMKGHTNRWWKMRCGERLYLFPADQMTDTERHADEHIDLCGEACVIKKVSEYLGSSRHVDAVG